MPRDDFEDFGDGTRIRDDQLADVAGNAAQVSVRIDDTGNDCLAFEIDSACFTAGVAQNVVGQAYCRDASAGNSYRLRSRTVGVYRQNISVVENQVCGVLRFAGKQAEQDSQGADSPAENLDWRSHDLASNSAHSPESMQPT